MGSNVAMKSTSERNERRNEAAQNGVLQWRINLCRDLGLNNSAATRERSVVS